MKLKGYKKFISDQINKNMFRKNVLTLFTGSFVSQVVLLITMPIITRIYNPEQFGKLAIFLSIVSLISIVATGQYELAIPIPRKEEDSRKLTSLTMLLSFLFSLSLMILIFLFFNKLASHISFLNEFPYVYLVPFVIFMTGFELSLNQLLIYQNRFRQISSSSIIKTSSTVVTQLISSLSPIVSGLGLILGQTVGQVSSILSLSWKSFPINKKEEVNLNVLKGVAVRYQKFPKYSLPASLLNVASSQIMVIFLGGYFGASVAGQFLLAQKILNIPVVLISSSVKGAFKERASREYRKTGSFQKLYRRTFSSLAKFGVIPFLGFLLFSPYIVPFIFGSEWELAGRFGQFFALLYFLRYITNPLSFSITLTENQDTFLKWQIVLVLSMLLIIYFSGFLNNPLLTVAVYALLYSLFYVVILILTYRYSRGSSGQ
ncbi:lipopolysaccharide biosynthesis protein [Patescibacteria group bacterium]